LDTPPYRLVHPEKIEEINKKLFSADRIAKRRSEILEQMEDEKQAILKAIQKDKPKSE
jgi:hypothetical protein